MVKVVLTLSEANPSVAAAVGLEFVRRGYQFKSAHFTTEHEYVMWFCGEGSVPSALSSEVSSICAAHNIAFSVVE